MKFLLDVNLPPSLCQKLSAFGHEAFHAGKSNLGKATDEALLDMAESKGFVLLTHDLDFGKLLAFSGKSRPSVIIFRLQQINAETLTRLLQKHWVLVESPLQGGAIIVIEKEDVRVRRLPIGEPGLNDSPGFHESSTTYKTIKPKPRKIKKHG